MRSHQGSLQLSHQGNQADNRHLDPAECQLLNPLDSPVVSPALDHLDDQQVNPPLYHLHNHHLIQVDGQPVSHHVNPPGVLHHNHLLPLPFNLAGNLPGNRQVSPQNSRLQSPLLNHRVSPPLSHRHFQHIAPPVNRQFLPLPSQAVNLQPSLRVNPVNNRLLFQAGFLLRSLLLSQHHGPLASLHPFPLLSLHRVQHVNLVRNLVVLQPLSLKLSQLDSRLVFPRRNRPRSLQTFPPHSHPINQQVYRLPSLQQRRPCNRVALLLHNHLFGLQMSLRVFRAHSLPRHLHENQLPNHLVDQVLAPLVHQHPNRLVFLLQLLALNLLPNRPPNLRCNLHFLHLCSRQHLLLHCRQVNRSRFLLLSQLLFHQLNRPVSQANHRLLNQLVNQRLGRATNQQ